MSESEQDQHLASLLLRQRKLGRKLACLESKIKNISHKLAELAAITESYGQSIVFPDRHRKFREEGGADIARYLEEFETALLESVEIDRQIKKIDG